MFIMRGAVRHEKGRAHGMKYLPWLPVALTCLLRRRNSPENRGGSGTTAEALTMVVP